MLENASGDIFYLVTVYFQSVSLKVNETFSKNVHWKRNNAELLVSTLIWKELRGLQSGLTS